MNNREKSKAYNKVVDFSKLSLQTKEQYVEYLLKNNIEFQQENEHVFSATLRLKTEENQHQENDSQFEESNQQGINNENSVNPFFKTSKVQMRRFLRPAKNNYINLISFFLYTSLHSKSPPPTHLKSKQPNQVTQNKTNVNQFDCFKEAEQYFQKKFSKTQPVKDKKKQIEILIIDQLEQKSPLRQVSSSFMNNSQMGNYDNTNMNIESKQFFSIKNFINGDYSNKENQNSRIEKPQQSQPKYNIDPQTNDNKRNSFQIGQKERNDTENSQQEYSQQYSAAHSPLLIPKMTRSQILLKEATENKQNKLERNRSFTKSFVMREVSRKRNKSNIELKSQTSYEDDMYSSNQFHYQNNKQRKTQKEKSSPQHTPYNNQEYALKENRKDQQRNNNFINKNSQIQNVPLATQKKLSEEQSSNDWKFSFNNSLQSSTFHNGTNPHPNNNNNHQHNHHNHNNHHNFHFTDSTNQRPSVGSAPVCYTAGSISEWARQQFPLIIGLLTLSDKGLRPTRWVRSNLDKILEEIYSNKFSKNTQQIKGKGRETITELYENSSFSLFIHQWYIQKYKMTKMAEQQVINLLASLEFHLMEGHDSANVNLFVKFTSEQYTNDELIYFLFVRSLIEKIQELDFVSIMCGKHQHISQSSNSCGTGSNLNNNRSKLTGNYPGGCTAATHFSSSNNTLSEYKIRMLSVEDCYEICKSIFGEDEQSLIQGFMKVITSQMSISSELNAKVMDVYQFLLISLEEYRSQKKSTRVVKMWNETNQIQFINSQREVEAEAQEELLHSSKSQIEKMKFKALMNEYMKKQMKIKKNSPNPVQNQQNLFQFASNQHESLESHSNYEDQAVAQEYSGQGNYHEKQNDKNYEQEDQFDYDNSPSEDIGKPQQVYSYRELQKGPNRFSQEARLESKLIDICSAMTPNNFDSSQCENNLKQTNHGATQPFKIGKMKFQQHQNDKNTYQDTFEVEEEQIDSCRNENIEESIEEDQGGVDEDNDDEDLENQEEEKEDSISDQDSASARNTRQEIKISDFDPASLKKRQRKSDHKSDKKQLQLNFMSQQFTELQHTIVKKMEKQIAEFSQLMMSEEEFGSLRAFTHEESVKLDKMRVKFYRLILNKVGELLQSIFDSDKVAWFAVLLIDEPNQEQMDFIEKLQLIYRNLVKKFDQKVIVQAKEISDFCKLILTNPEFSKAVSELLLLFSI